MSRKLFARLHDEREALVVRVDPDEKEMLMKAEPETFFGAPRTERARLFLSR